MLYPSRLVFWLSVYTLAVGANVSSAQIVSATCDGSASDDTPMLNNTILTAYTAYSASGKNTNSSAPGPQIQIHGFCSVNATIVLYGGMSYVGDSKTGTVIQQAASANLPAVVADYSWTVSGSSVGDNAMTVAHLTIDGNSANNSQGVGLVVRSWDSTFEDLQIQNTPGDGLLFSNAASDNTLLASGDLVNNHFSNLFIQNTGGHGFHVSDDGTSGNRLTDGWLENTAVSNPADSAIYMDNSAGWVIRGNHVYAVPQDGIEAGRCFGTTIDDNYIENFGVGGSGGTSYFGIQCAIESGPGSIISNNKIFQINGQGGGNYYFINTKLVGGTGSIIGYVNVLGNLLTGPGTNDTGIYYSNVGGASTMLNYVSANNQLTGMTTPLKHDTYTTAVTPY